MVMSAKYIPASLLMVSRMLDRPIPRFIDFMILFSITAKPKTVISFGTDRRAIAVSDGSRKSDRMPTEDKREEQLNNREVLLNVGKTQMIRIQGSREYCRCRKRFS